MRSQNRKGLSFGPFELSIERSGKASRAKGDEIIGQGESLKAVK